ncbi:hydroxyacid dehydrogenase [Sinorhizobium meliloti]|uniref:hydroxyacid dehydrogenase n=1 Tax=Rhizobium meliloti TaxID=382 RepID=UPI000FD2BED8|nr:hydroxyacid dehydrogenase [Sinorhizobium meliloti]QGJ78535.1 hydroxyacid dehydrogenase [Sinorhizobium meliloti]RVJ80522.1 hydroxyacid dehydrogenase [Sinorhizobium meliloti]RVJ98467.1 hydroxyacid dehydrogenase [Sinorhizobium meliloti]RVM67434.1 hydroxyacid dehydrogenase [Sinorhizobium meliloti]RVM80210.1 hydroxyacid dehydrogenase [Sinorhizobium meliloti]
MTLPTVAFAMQPERTRYVLTPELLAQVDAFARILDQRPMTEFADEWSQRLLAEAQILVTGWGAPFIDAAVLARAPRLRLIVHAAGTIKGLVDESVFDAGIRVSHAAEANAVPVAEFTLAAVIFAGKQVFRFRDVYAADRGRERTQILQGGAVGNHRRTVGIVGASRIGRRVIGLLRHLDYRLLLYDPLVKDAEAMALEVEKVDLDTLMARSDIVSLHAPLLPETRHMIDNRQLALMKDGATLINTARGALVDEAALIEKLQSGAINAVIDVTDPEIPDENSPLYDLPNVFLTPHIAGAIGLERMRLGEMAVDEVARFLEGRPLLFEVHKQDLGRMA